MKDGWTDDALECHKLELADAFTALTSDIGGERERQRETEEEEEEEEEGPRVRFSTFVEKCSEEGEKRRRQGCELSFLDYLQLQRGKTSVFAASYTTNQPRCKRERRGL